MKYAAHEAYTPTTIDWIGDIPSHWALKRLKYVANRVESKVEADENNPLPYIGLEHVAPWTGRLIDLDEDLVPTGVSNRFEAGDTLFGKLRPYLAKACNVDFSGLCSSELLVLRGKTYDRNFLLYQLLSHGFISLVDSSTYGSKMPRASWDFIGVCELPLPLIDEQQAIARFLDAKTAQIDELVAKKRQLIDKLKEKRSALIARTVTRGLPPEAAKAAGLEPNPEMKDSGVEWFGEIPSHWSVARLRHKCQIVDCKHKTVSFVDDGIPLASIKEVHDFEVALEDAKMTTVEEYYELIEGGRKPHVGDLIYSRNASVGDAALVTTDSTFCMGQDVCLVRVKEHDGRFMAYLFRSHPLKEQVESLMIGSTFRRINVGQIKAFWICLPPPQEQRSIAGYLDREMEKLERLSSEVETAIERLTEYRQALITSAVTGKIDVREAVA